MFSLEGLRGLVLDNRSDGKIKLGYVPASNLLTKEPSSVIIPHCDVGKF